MFCLSETVGMLAIFRFLLRFFEYWRLPFPPMLSKNSTDSLSLISTLKTVRTFGEDWYSSTLLWNHVDVIQQLAFTMAEFHPLKFQPYHVKGHADKTKKWNNMTREEQLNLISDEEANKALTQQTVLQRTTTSKYIRNPRSGAPPRIGRLGCTGFAYVSPQ